MSKRKPSTTDCRGCRDNFYNGNNDLGVGRCWSLDSATFVRVRLVPMSMRPPWNGLPIEKKPNCYRKPGYASMKVAS